MATQQSTIESVTLPAFSMFMDTPVEVVGENVVFGLMRDAVVADPTDELYIVTQMGERRLDLISTLFYGTPQLGWVIGEVNNLVDLLLFVPYGTELRIPTKQRLSQEGILTT